MKFSMYFCKKILSQDRPLSVFSNPTNTYITSLQEIRKGTQKNSPADVKAARLKGRKEHASACLFCYTNDYLVIILLRIG